MSLSKDPIDLYINNKSFYYTPSARVAFKEILKIIDFNKSDRILLPAYIGITDREGSGVFDPVRQLKIKFDFYALDDTLSLDYKDIVSKVKQGGIKALLVIHYFGFFQKNMLELRQLCRKKNIVLIEDCAHAMDLAFRDKGTNSAGNIGDYALYSIHKYLPTTDGGFYTFKKNEPVNSDCYDSKNISHESLYRLQIADYEQIRLKRISNYNYMLKKIKPNTERYSLLHPKLGKDVVPHDFPVLIKNKKREKLYFKLIDKEVPVVALYYRLIEEISKSIYPVSYTISESILNFPIHQDIQNPDMDYMLTCFHKLLKEI